MVLLDESIVWVRDQIDSNINKGQCGTGGTIATSSDTALEDPDGATLIDTTSSKSGNQITFSFKKSSTVGSGTIYREYGLRDTSNSVDWTRFVFTPLAASASEDWNIKVRMFIRSV